MKKATGNFAERIKQARLKLEISQEEMAHSLGVSFATVNRWENSKTAPSKLARKQFEEFCTKMIRVGKLSKCYLAANF